MAHLLARYSIPSGTRQSITVTSAVKLSPTEAMIQYTRDAVDYADVFQVTNDADMELLLTGAGDGEHLNAIIERGGSNPAEQPSVVSVTTIVEE